jgi:membrane-anchored protein YejM (alkaline phosphatase superfamily)
VLKTSIATIVLITLMIITAKIWGWAKKTYPNHASIFVKVVIAALLIIFIVS